jgi:hypothetical protein
MKRLLIIFAFLSSVSAFQTFAQEGNRQSPQTAQSQKPATDTQQTNEIMDAQTQIETPKSSLAPQQFSAQYQGGLFGYTKKVKGTLYFDDANKRLVFRDLQNKEIFGLPYKSLLVVEPTSQAVRPTAATVASAIPVPYGLNIPFGFIRSKSRYLTVQFNDPDSQVQGTTSFKVADKQLLQSVVQSLGQKAELKQRGEAFYRPRQIGEPEIL